MKASTQGSRRFILLAILIAIICMFSMTAYPQSCGTYIDKDIVLNSDLGPCPSYGLYAIGNLTINLNGHAIRGQGRGSGIIAEHGVTITGPGEITGFAIGVHVVEAGVQNPVTMTSLLLTHNGTGIVTNEGSMVRIVGNTITRGGSGIGMYASGGKIKGNLITRNSEDGIRTSSTGWPLEVVGNLVKENGAGLNLPYTEFVDVPITVQSNDFSANQRTGVTLTGNNIKFEANYVSHNRGDGIVLSTGNSYGLQGNLVKDNVVRNNWGNGISVVNSYASVANQIVDNEGKNNRGADLYWDGRGTTSCWKLNDVKTSQPSSLPACQ